MMSLNLSIAGRAKLVKFYNLSRLEIEGLDISQLDLEQKEDIEEFFEKVLEFTETGEAEAYEPPLEVHGCDTEICTIKLKNTEEYVLSADEITLKNIHIDEILKDIQHAKEGDIYFVKCFEGDALWDFDSDYEGEVDPSKFKIGYIDCTIDIDQYEALSAGYYDILCDIIYTDYIEYDNSMFELVDFVFHPMKIYAQLYIVKKDPVTGLNILEKVDFGGRMISDVQEL
ncbi:hypothetical protein [Nitrosophilus alvini]|uniref:hypothetical protein n=1 Tax=Nitrosophilus alvini TaxID=2714855 RepID=UPI00190AC9AB|nr:hypothetical protein [Nitrosophilus alvini]